MIGTAPSTTQTHLLITSWRRIWLSTTRCLSLTRCSSTSLTYNIANTCSLYRIRYQKSSKDSRHTFKTWTHKPSSSVYKTLSTLSSNCTIWSFGCLKVPVYNWACSVISRPWLNQRSWTPALSEAKSKLRLKYNRCYLRLSSRWRMLPLLKSLIRRYNAGLVSEKLVQGETLWEELSLQWSL